MKERIIKGFTLIELLVVISIIGMIVAFAMFGMQGAFEASRDTNRKSDIEQYEAALEIYANNHGGFYPVFTGSGIEITTLCAELDLASNCIDDPEADTSVSYQYSSDASGVNYAIWAQLEGDDENVWMVCSGGLVGNSGQKKAVDGVCSVGSVAVIIDPGGGGGGDGICSVGGIGTQACTDQCIAGGNTVGGYCTLDGKCVCLDGTNSPSCVANVCETDCITIGFDSGSCEYVGPDAAAFSCECSDGGAGGTECFDSDGGIVSTEAGYVTDVTGATTRDSCVPTGGVYEIYCGSAGDAISTIVPCELPLTCISDAVGAYCGSQGGSEIVCIPACTTGEICSPISNQCECDAGLSTCSLTRPIIAGCYDVMNDDTHCGTRCIDCTANNGTCTNGQCLSGGGVGF